MLSFPSQLKAWRHFRGLTQQELAERALMARPNLIDLENGKRDCTLRTLERIAAALDIKPGKLLDELPQSPKTLNRYELDALSRAIIDPNSPLSPSLKNLKDALEPLFYGLLRAAGKETTGLQLSRNKYPKSHAEALLGRETVFRVTQRVNKLLSGGL